jgi:hypothetical protein
VGKYVNTIGLIFGILGVLLLFKWGPPQPSFERGVALGLEDGTKLPNGKTVAQHDADIEALTKRHKCMSQIGLVLIGLGFAFQLLSVWIT